MESASELRTAALPLTPAQQGVWLAILRNPAAAAAYNLASSLELPGDTDLDRLRGAIQIVVDQLPALRLEFFEAQSGRTLLQQIRGSFEVAVPLVDLSGESNPEASAELWVQRETHRPFRISDFPHFRIALVRLRSNGVRAFAIYHHLIVDGIGMQLIGRYIAETYSALLRGEKPLRLDMHAHVNYLRAVDAYRDSLQFSADREYFRNLHAGINSVASLSTRPRRRTTPQRPLSARRACMPGETQTLMALARRVGVSSSKLLIGAVVLLLHRLTRLDAITLGLPVHGRGSGSAIVRPLVWMCASVLPLKISCIHNASLIDFLRAVAAQLDEALTHQAYPMDDMAQQLADRSPQDLYGMVVNVVRSRTDAAFGGAKAKATTISQGPVDDLSVLITDRDQGRELEIELYANPEMYAQWEVDSYADALLNLIREFVFEPNRSIGEIDLVPRADSAAASVTDACEAFGSPPVHELIAQSAAEHPDRIAAVAGNRSITYAALLSRARELAHRLVGLGIQPGQVVAVTDDRSLDMLIGILGVLMSGAAYLPIDKELPFDRVRLLIQDSAAVAIVDSAGMVDANALQIPSIHCLRLNPAVPATYSESEVPLAIRVTGRDLVYVIYTSGSTGMPKGVQIEHGSLSHVLFAIRDLLALKDKQFTMAAISSITFDIAGLELFLPLILGQTVAIASRECARDGARLLQFITDHEVTVLQATPTTWRMLLAAGSIVPDLIALCGGERLTTDLACRLQQACREVWNLYGPTETTIWSTAYRLGPQQDTCIGYPLGSTSVAVVDHYIRNVPIGCVGELLIGGVGVARGYLNRADLEALQFIRSHDGQRQYRTGDLVRMRRDGALEFMGRRDDQIKVAGHRIEPAEIEAALCEIPEVRGAVVTGRQDPSGALQLVAYVQATGEVRASALRNALAGRLPRYMLPMAFVGIEQWPLTASGKVDRNALPAPERPMESHGHTAPQSAVEMDVHKLVAEVLGHSAFGMEDTFVELGGQSLSALQLVISLKERFAIDISVDTVLGAMSLSQLANAVATLTNQELSLT